MTNDIQKTKMKNKKNTIAGSTSEDVKNFY